MLLYGLIVLISLVLAVALNAFLNPMGFEWHYYLIATLIFIVASFIVDAIVASAIRAVPEKYINKESKFYNLSRKSLEVFKFLGVTKWKDRVPELGNFTSFHKNKVEKPNDNEYIARFILEVCYGISIHFWSVFAGILIIFIDYKMFLGTSNIWLTVGIPVFIVNAILNLMPYMILTFNLPRLKAIYKFNISK